MDAGTRTGSASTHVATVPRKPMPTWSAGTSSPGASAGTSHNAAPQDQT
ncbi:hypothetical protein SK803_02305 [Lentzea sp. BCCO 10_0856]|uniref:Uncharacterized protein n=1 Tax=Lentzea miocenica TaxID=3095431 RepID=A0ABU4ST54_9PSEU|nr:hypothetical protein [Lentzea sp. BCCO 10_0856]MDX8029020.1 hypothetical protein [Lentzea sp. BCCO 10_0856]